MASKRHVLFLATHPVQYSAPLFRRMANDPRLDIKVGFQSLAGATPSHDVGFGRTFQWDIPLLDGYSWVELARRDPNALVGLLDERRWDALVLHIGYRHALFWSAIRRARARGIPVLFGTDAIGFESRSARRHALRSLLKRLVLPVIFRLAAIVVVPSTRSRDFVLGMGLAPERVVVTPYVVDNDWWIDRAMEVDREAVRQSWGIPVDATIFLFCAKLQPWKRPHDLLLALARVANANAFAVFVGEGPLKQDLVDRAAALGITGRTRFLGFANQTELPAIYRGCDVLVLPSEYEPFGVVVNEAMLCGCTVIVTDRVGAGGDLVDGETGFVYRAGDVEALRNEMDRMLADASALGTLRVKSLIRVRQWSPALNVDRLIEAVDRSRPTQVE